MIMVIKDVLVSSELKNELFACDIAKCKGACCVEGELGAPLTDEEMVIIDEIYDKLEPYLRPEGKEEIKKQGRYVKDSDGDYSTPLLNGRECAYATFKNGTAQCGIEQAYFDGKVDFRKPISCHLYPVRTFRSKHSEMEALNYDRWDICSPACSLGAKNGTRVYEFVKDALIRKYGEEFYTELDAVIQDQIAKESE